MNFLENKSMMMVAHIWIPKSNFSQLIGKLPSVVNIRERKTQSKPPTHF